MVSPDADRSVKGGGGMPCAAFGAPIMHPPHMTGIQEKKETGVARIGEAWGVHSLSACLLCSLFPQSTRAAAGRVTGCVRALWSSR